MSSKLNMPWLGRLLEQRRMILSLAFMLSLVGLASWFFMIRQEDPFFPYRAGTIITPFPGSDPARIERLVVKPLEEELAQIEEIDQTWSRIRTNVSLTTILLKDHVYDTDVVWDKVRRAIKKAQLEYPDGVLEPELDDKVMDASTVVLAVTGSGDPIELLNAARKVKQRLYKVAGVSRIELFGEPGEQVNVLLRDADANRLNMSPQFLASQLQNRNELVPGGSVRVAGKSATLRPNTEFTSIEEIRRTPIQLPNGEYLPLEAIAEVRYGPKEPADEEFWWNSQRAVGISLIAIPNKVNAVQQGEDIRAMLPALRKEVAPLQIEEMFFQPDRVDQRLKELSGSLLSGVFIVAGVLFFFMGLRLGLVVASIVPLVTFTAVAIYSMGGGVLHQVAVIGLVVALGMLVDNAIVMGENIQYRLDSGDSPNQAAANSVKELAAPLGTATGTTLAAFVPMLMSNGNAADFTRGIPTMVMLTLTISYFFAVLVTPILASWGLRAKHQTATAASNQPSVWEKIGAACGNAAVKAPLLVVIAAFALVIGSGYMMKFVQKQFFPYADRNQLLIEVALPEGTHLDLTRERMSQIEGEVSLLPEVKSVYSFVGTTGPRFYYNLPTLPRSPNKGRLVVITESHTQVPGLMKWVREYALGNMPDTEVVPRQLGQGPPITAPVEVRVYSENITDLEVAVEKVYEWLREAPGSVDVRHDLGVGVPSLKFDVNDAVAMRYGHSRQDVATTLLGRTQGIEIGQFRAGDDPVPIKLRSRDGENFPIEQLPSVNVYGNQGPAVPLMQLANIDIEWQPGAILRRDFSRYATVSANLLDGVGHEQVLAYVLPKIAEASESGELPSTVTTKLGGEADASGEANSALLGAAPLGLMMLLFFLLLEFNSFRRVLIIMATVPLVMIGVIPGLVITGSPFGFNSMVGCIALVGIVVNNAIVLIDVIDARLKEGGDLTLAIKEAVARRTRPIILTTFTTVAGLSPLTVTSATAWPPMAWAIISGLLASTVLTLVVIPALCKLLLSSRKNKAQPKAAATVAMAVIAVFGLSYGESSYAQIGQYPGEEELQHIDQVVDYEGARDYANMTPITLLESIRMAAERPQVKAEVARTYARKHEAHELFRKAWLPSLTVTAYAAKADRESNATFPPAGPGAPPTVISVAERERYGGTVEVRQTLFNAANGIYRLQAAKLAAQAQGLITYRQGELATTLSSPAFLRALSFDAQVEAATAALASQKLQLKDAQSLAKTGRLTDADLQLAQVQLLQAEHHLHELKSEQRINLSDFARTIGSPVLRRPELPVARVWNLITIPSLEEAFEFTRETREDFRAQRLQLKALEKQRAAVGAEAIPSVGLTAQYTRNEGQTFQSEEEAFVGAQITWQPLAGGARASKRKALANEYAALKQELLESERTLWFDLLESAEHFRLAHEQVELTEKAVSASQAALENQQKREKAGLASAAALAGAQARADEHRASLKRAQIAVIGHWLHFHVVMGSTVEDALNKYGPGIEALNMQ